ncbi:MAG: Prophage CP4-57 regulatory [Magnetococcales bacterium]|nr:Prophage CP4-57 regulatory [Magnetococcales bacterium]HIJ85705.1 AlpA family transcriptional regulator [Magnetococcales bacterium]
MSEQYQQPFHPGVQTTDRLLRKKEVLAVSGLAVSSLYDLIRRGDFPRPRKLGERSVAWRESEIRAWIESRQPVEG